MSTAALDSLKYLAVINNIWPDVGHILPYIPVYPFMLACFHSLGDIHL
jgi:hypothetical protein